MSILLTALPVNLSISHHLASTKAPVPRTDNGAGTRTGDLLLAVDRMIAQQCSNRRLAVEGITSGTGLMRSPPRRLPSTTWSAA